MKKKSDSQHLILLFLKLPPSELIISGTVISTNNFFDTSEILS